MVRRLELLSMNRDAPHKDVECSYSFVTHPTGERCLQLDTYGSSERKVKGGKNQSIRMNEAALRQLYELIRQHLAL
jgi:hypothetical protein